MELKDSNSKQDHKILHLLPYENPLLRIQAQTIRFPLSDDEIELIENMLYSVEEPQLKAAKGSLISKGFSLGFNLQNNVLKVS